MVNYFFCLTSVTKIKYRINLRQSADVNNQNKIFLLTESFFLGNIFTVLYNVFFG